MNNIAVSSSNEDVYQHQAQHQDKMTLTPLHPSTVLYMGTTGQTSIKKEPLEGGGGVYSYHHGLHMDSIGQLSYASSTEDLPSSRGRPPTTDVSTGSSSRAEPEVYTTLTVSTPLMAHTDPAGHHLHPTEYIRGHNQQASAHLLGSGMNSSYMEVPEDKGDGTGQAGVNHMARVMCGEMEPAEEKELAKLQTVQMDEDMADL